MGYGRLKPRVDAFLGSIGSPASPYGSASCLTQSLKLLLRDGLHTYTGTTIARHRLPSCVTPHAHHPSLGSQPPPRITRRIHEVLDCLALLVRSLTVYRRYGNINPLSIDYACRPRLRSRLTQGGLTWPWNPWSFGGRVSHPSFATHACILTRVASTAGSHRRFTRHTTLSYPSIRLDHEGLPVI